jgi:predicted DNA-binding transcriptional regulator YafY
VRADRLIALLLFLQQKGRVTAAQVAEELEVSARTARRDLEALAMSGVPVYSTHGRGGGWQLLGGASTDLTGLSADEARALFLAVGPTATSTPELQQALRKLTGALPETFRPDAHAATAAIRIDPAAWGRTAGPGDPQHLDDLTHAVVTGRQVWMDYDSARRTKGPRIAHPLGLVTKRNVWYLVANTDAGVRTFRVGRIRELRLLDDPVDRPPDFDLDDAWAEIVAEVEKQRIGLRVRAHVHPSFTAPLHWVFGANCEVHGETEDGWIDCSIGDASHKSFAAQIAGWGNRIRLLDPPDQVVDELRRITAELRDTWGDVS